ncbi:response regulator transcription factor [Gemmiger sp.]
MEKLLIVDDEEIELDGMAELIDWPSYGYELVGTAINGKRGLALIEEKRPDIVITDIKMPVMDGLAMIRAAQDRHADTVFVVLSGYGDYEYTSQAMQLGIRHYILKPCDETKILPVLEQARAELHDRRSKARKTGEMESTVRRMAPMAREKALHDLLLGRETPGRLPGITGSLGGTDRKLLLLLMHTKDGIDHLEQYAIANMMADLLPEGGLLGDTSVAQDVCLLVDAALYDQLPQAVERLCAEFARFRSGALTVTGSARGTAGQLAELYEQARRLLTTAPENTLTLLERLNAEQHKAAHLMDYDALRNADSYAALCFACCETLLSMQLGEISPGVQRDVCVRAVRYICSTAPDTDAVTYAELLGYMADNIWRHRTGGEPQGKATRTEQLILREFYAHLPEKEFTMQWFAREILFMNPDYLSRKLQQLTGDKFATRLTADRIELARRLLATAPDVKLSALAELVGFASDEQYFSRTFRKIVGVTPKQYAMGL